MEIIKFKTNVATQEQILRISPFLDKLKAVKRWQIDTEAQEHILSVSGEDLDPQQIKNALAEAGFEAEILRVIGIGGEEV
jgi:copper chaperone